MATATAPPTATNDRRLDTCIDRFSSLDRNFAADAIGSPLDEPLFERTDETFRDECEDRQQEHAGEHTVEVEGGHRVVDQLAETRGGPEQLADDGADDGEAEADVEAGENPGERGRDDDLQGEAPVVGTEDASVRHQVAVHLAHALEGIEEDDEEDEHDGCRCLAPERQTKHDGEEGAEPDSRNRVRRFDEWRESLREQLD